MQARRHLLRHRDAQRPRRAAGRLDVAPVERRRVVGVAVERTVHDVEHQRAVSHGAGQPAVDAQSKPALAARLPSTRGRGSPSSRRGRTQLPGIRIEPPPSEPVAHGTRPAATAAADPPEDPPGVRVTSHGLRVTPLASVAVHGKIVSSGTFVIPIGIAPAARRRRTASASARRRRSVAARAARRRLALDGKIVLDRDRYACRADR